MLKCQLSELQRTLKVTALLLNHPVTTKVINNDVNYYVGVVHVGTERGLTPAMLEASWEDRFKSDKVYVYPEYLHEAEHITSTDADVERMYQQLVIRSRQCHSKFKCRQQTTQ